MNSRNISKILSDFGSQKKSGMKLGRRSLVFVSFCILGQLFLVMASANLAMAYVGSVSSATANTGVGTVEASEAPFLNPAALGHIKGYYFYSGMGVSRQTTTATNQDLAFSLTDAMRETVVPTSLGYVQNSRQFEGEFDSSISRSFRLAFGNSFRKNLAFGLTVAYNNDRFRDQNYQQTNLEAGFLWTPSANFGAGIQFKNLLKPDSEIPEYVRFQQRSLLGLSYNYKKFMRAKIDVSTDSANRLNYTTLGFGMESYLNRWLIFRWGVGRDNEEASNQYSAGLGFMGPKFALHYAYQSSPQNERLTRHSVDLAVPIW